jgi:WD40 repeat protein/serine/threonine protein kinase
MGELEDLCGRTVGDFVLRERIDEGGFGAVYRCEQTLLGREAVVKVLHQRLRRNDVVLQRFMREAQLASRLDHPYAAHVYAFGIEPDDGLFWIAMEMVQGTALNRWLRDRGPLSLNQLVPFFDRVAEVVQAAHERGIVHRDLKPSNVMVIERAGRLLPKLLDFGIAKLLDEAALPLPPTGSARHAAVDELPPEQWANPSEMATLTGNTEPPVPHANGHRLTHADATIGSPPYMSPEQWNNAVTVGPASDLYALGVVAYEALTGRRPFTASSISEYVDMHCNYPVPPLGDGFSPAMDRLFQRALAKRPEDRWSTALELATALRSASGLGATPSDLPRLDPLVRDRWIADAPQPLAESIAALDGARNAHQARDAAQELVRNLLRYLLAIGLATRAQVRDDRDDPALLDLVRTLRRRDLDEDERVRLLRLLVRPLMSRRGAHPVPELVDLVTPRAEDGTDGLDPLLALHPTSDHAGSEDLVRSRLGRLLPELAILLHRLSFILDYVVIVPRNAIAEQWTGLRRQRRAQAGVTGGELVKHHPMLLDRDGKVCVDLWPLAQIVAPSEGAEAELFLFDGRGRNGARMIAAPADFEHHDPSVWEWIAARVIAEIEVHPEVVGDGPPYLGLTPFSTGDAGRYVGREAEVDAFINRLRQRPLQVVVGPSGAGKTSFVNAGVIPALPLGWRAVALRPGAAPLTALASKIVAANLGPADLRTLLETSPASAAAAIAAAAGRSTVVVVVDHLEELFTQCMRPEERVQFAAALAELAASADGPLRVVGAIRDDFLMELDSLPPLRALLSPAIALLGNPSRDALVRIVVEPARRAGYAMSDPELANDMVNVVADHPGALALLSFTASRLWELRDRRFRQLTRNAYDAMGGIGGALGRHAEDTFDRLSPEEQRLAREIFRHLVTADGTRALVTGKELRQRLANPRADAVIDKLVAARLVAISDSAGEPHVEVIHDVLILAWPRLQQWIREDVDDARTRDQLRISARQWQDRSRSHALLWRGDVLADLERWLRRPAARALSDLEVAFIAASRRDARRAIRGKRVLLAIAAAFMMLFGVLQYRSMQKDVQRQLDDARIIQMYIEQGRTRLVDGKNAEALLYLAQALYRGDDSPNVRFMVEQASLPIKAEVLRLSRKATRAWSATYFANGTRIATGDDLGGQVWDARTGAKLFALPATGTTYQVIASPGDDRLYTLGADGRVRIWAAASGISLGVLAQPENSTGSYRVGAISPDGRLLAAIDQETFTARVWNTESKKLLTEFGSRSSSAARVAFSHSGRWLVVTDGDELQLVDVRSWTPAPRLPLVAVRALAFDPKEDHLVTGSASGEVAIWSIPDGTRTQLLHEVGDAISQVAFAPNGDFVAAGSDDGSVLVWSSRTGSLQSRLVNHVRSVRCLAFDAASKLVASGGADGRLSISEVGTGMPITVLQNSINNTVADVHFDPSSRYVVAAAWDGAVRVWDIHPPYRRWTSQEIGRECGTNVSPDEDRRFIVVGCDGHDTRVWDTAHDKLLAELPSVVPVDNRYNRPLPVVSADGARVAIADGDTVVIYALPGGRPLRTVHHAAVVTAVAFRATGYALVSGSADGELKLTVDEAEASNSSNRPSPVDAVGVLHDGRIVAAYADRHLVVYGANLSVMNDLLVSPTRIRAFRMARGTSRFVSIPVTGSPAPPVLWDVDSPLPPRKLEGHSSQVFSAKFVLDGKEILTASTDGTARMWDAATGRLKQTYFGSPSALLDAAMSPDGRMVVTAGADGILRFWDTASGLSLWSLRAHKSLISGVHFEGHDLVTRGFTGEISRWQIRATRSAAELIRDLDPLMRCIPLRFDPRNNALVAQSDACDVSAVGAP